jgi:GNAT superfamily N-acetyltransferase
MIRFATPTDAVRIAEIHVATWRVAYRGIVPDGFLASLSVEKRAERWRRGIEADPRLVFVSEREATMFGWISIGPGRDDDSKSDGEVYALYVQPETWTRGIGRELMATGESELWRRGVSRIVLWVLEANSRARSFYETLGYVPDSRTKEITFGETKLTEIRYEKKRKAA